MIVMEILSYSPSIEAYAKAGDTYYDLSDDITSCTVSRTCDRASSFKMVLQNRNGKYNNVFTPMDQITIYATKQERVQVFTGYITSVDKFTLYPKDFNMSGYDTIYLLQQFYWDAGLEKSQELSKNFVGKDSQSFDSGYWKIISSILTDVVGWKSDNIVIDSQIPSDVMNWAKKIYDSKITDIKKLKKNVDEFYKILQTSGPKAGGVGTAASSVAGSTPVTNGAWTCGVRYTCYGTSDGDDNGIAGWTGTNYGSDGLGVAIPMYSGIGVSTENPNYPGLGLQYGAVLQLRNPVNQKCVNVIVNDCGNFGLGNKYNNDAYLDLQPGPVTALGLEAESNGTIDFCKLSQWTSDPTGGKGPYQ